ERHVPRQRNGSHDQDGHGATLPRSPRAPCAAPAKWTSRPGWPWHYTPRSPRTSSLRSLDELDLVAGGERHHGLLPGATPTLESPHPLPLALAGGRADRGDLHVEDLLDGVADLHLVDVRRYLEGHRVQLFLLLHALLGHQRPQQHRARVLHD